MGDDAQSVYGFRGADIRNILDFQKDFPDARVVRLEQNYRSTGTILRAANAIIANNRGSMPKELWSELGEGSPLHVSELEDEHAEARFVVGEVERLLDSGMQRSEIAVFYRTNAMSRVIEDMLVRREIAYQVIGGREVLRTRGDQGRDRLPLAARQPLRRRELHAYRELSPPRHRPDLACASLRICGEHRGERVGGRLRSRARTRPHAGRGERAHGFHGHDVASCASWRASGASRRAPRLGARRRPATSTRSRREGTIEAEGRIENLEQLVEVAREFDTSAQPGEETLDAFLQQVALSTSRTRRKPRDRGADGPRDADDASQREGHGVPGGLHRRLRGGVIPHSRALEEGGLEEERRLFYVGITRAMRELYLTYARRRALFGAGTYGLRSRFLDEIPAELAEAEREHAPSTAGRRLRRHRRARRSLGRPPQRERWASGAGASERPPRASGLARTCCTTTFGEGVVTSVEPGGLARRALRRATARSARCSRSTPKRLATRD